MAEAEKPDPRVNNNQAVPQPGTVVAPNAAGPPAKAVPVATTPAPQPSANVPAAPVPALGPTQAVPPPAPVPAAAPATPPAQAPMPPAPPVQLALAPTAPETPETPPDSDLSQAEFTDDGQGIAWTASEFVAHDKSTGWYIMLATGTLLMSIIVFIITRDKFSTGVIIIVGLLLGIYGSHKPRQLEYRLNQYGVGIAGKNHSYDEFKSFSVVPEGAFSSIVFMPLKRFGVPLTIYYAPDDEDEILALLADQLPFEEHHADVVDSLMRRIRF